ncbi:hypothetical protein P355_0591 [Burkholderia cenocepacia KC-01]|nr:hypothetical protein P355_0591 [Burkholderia cenocepacia KC-01]
MRRRAATSRPFLSAWPGLYRSCRVPAAPVAPAGFHPVIRMKAIRILAGGRRSYGWLQIGSA